MKKLYIIMFAVLSLAGFAAAEVGIGLKAGGGEDDNNLKEAFIVNPNNYSSDENSGVAGVEVLWQQGGLFNLDAQHVIGAKAGFDIHGEAKFKDFTTDQQIKTNIFKIPVTAYYKYAPQEMPFNFWAGAGATMAKIKWEYNDYGTGDSASLSNTLVYPHIKAGAEWRPNKLFGLGLDVGYNFGGEFKAAGAFKRDISGFEGFLAARFYFL